MNIKPIFQETKIGNYMLPVEVLNTVLRRGDYIAPHWHEFYEILFFYKGTTNVQLNSEHYTLHIGDVMLIDSMDVHAFFGESEYWVLEFDKKISDILMLDSRLFFPVKDAHKIIYSDRENTQELDLIRIQMESIVRCSIEKKPGHELDIRAHIYHILASILRINIEIKGVVENQWLHKKRLIKIDYLLKYIAENYANDISSSDAADLLNLEHSYFCRFFKRFMGKTFMEFLNFYRCTKAEELLLTSEWSITDIAYRVGFNSSSYFSTIYKKYFGYPPSREWHHDY